MTILVEKWGEFETNPRGLFDSQGSACAYATKNEIKDYSLYQTAFNPVYVAMECTPGDVFTYAGNFEKKRDAKIEAGDKGRVVPLELTSLPEAG